MMQVGGNLYAMVTFVAKVRVMYVELPWQDRDHNIPVQILKLDKTTLQKRLKMTLLRLLSPNMGFFVFCTILKKKVPPQVLLLGRLHDV